MERISVNGGFIQTKHALKLGIHQRTLQKLVEEKRLEKVSRGIYRIPHTPLANPDFFTVATRIPKGVICLISALSFHRLTTQIPHSVQIALDRQSETPRLDWPPLSVHRFSGRAFHEGIEVHKIDGAVVKIYCPEKTLADCFKFRNKLGMDIVLEALKLYCSKRKRKLNDLYKYAEICRVNNAIHPYLETLAYS
ncbi:MAG TPA: type IV toxin-antitoxin system AbiEi family antitoxin domain-containing protein [Cyclobacteriaceae bacterium]|nr:type IV toxin-antitoxin system AbiEi family antitoxin domain-containing protein [Cyclobacteriaceae bacterium]